MWRRYGPIVLVVLLAMAVLPDWKWELRFDIPVLNYWFIGLLWLSIPIASAWALLPLGRRIVRRISIVIVSVVVGIPCLVLSLMVFAFSPDVLDGEDPSFILRQSLPVGNSQYRLYLSSCGATCAYASVLRREIETPLGIKAVSHLWAREMEGSEQLVLTRDHRVRVVSNGVVLYETDR